MRDKIVDADMVYDESGYELEKAWCNLDVKKLIADAREADKIKSGPLAYYSAFEELAEYSLKKDGKTCADLDREE
ncbi:MAG: hypothetical protein ABSD38_14085 [Syntrophorhabdales bacterium]